jgi:hypothetical protein
MRTRLLQNRAFKVRMNTGLEVALRVPGRDENLLNRNDFE